MRARIVAVLVLVTVCLASGEKAASDPAADVLAFEREMEAAVVRGDVAFLDRACSSDFSFTHGDGWTVGGPPLRVENKAQMAGGGRESPVPRARSRLGQGRAPWGRCDHLRTVPRAEQGWRSRAQGVYCVVRARLRETRWSLAIPVASDRERARLRQGISR